MMTQAQENSWSKVITSVARPDAELSPTGLDLRNEQCGSVLQNTDQAECLQV